MKLTLTSMPDTLAQGCPRIAIPVFTDGHIGVGFLCVAPFFKGGGGGRKIVRREAARLAMFFRGGGEGA